LSIHATAVAASPAVSMEFCPISTVTNTAGELATDIHVCRRASTLSPRSLVVALT